MAGRLVLAVLALLAVAAFHHAMRADAARLCATDPTAGEAVCQQAGE